MTESSLDYDSQSNADNFSSAGRPKKGTTTFLLTTYRMLEDKENAQVIRWQKDGNSFVITGIEEFVKILPKYFKTRNYSSFVRQLNLYNFHKIKNQEGLIEFGHEQFRKGAIENLQFITRKINQDSELGRQKMKSQKPLSFEYNRLLGIIRNLENSLRLANGKNESLSAENQRLSGEIEAVRRQAERETRTLLYILFLLTSNYEPGINARVLHIIQEHRVAVDPALAAADMTGLRHILEESRIVGLDNSGDLLEALLQFAVAFHNSRAQNLNNKIQMENVLASLDHDNQSLPPLPAQGLLRINSACARSDLFARDLSPLKRLPSVARFEEESSYYEYPDNNGMELETDSQATGVCPRLGKDEPESIFPEKVFLFNPVSAGKCSS